MKVKFQTLKKLLPDIKRDIPLKRYTTFKIGGKAKFFFEAGKKENLISAILVAGQLKLPFFIVGGGSNLLIADEGFDGLVIKVKNRDFKIKKNKIITEAGMILGQLVNIATKNNLRGLEWAAGIPGTVGGAIYGNAGAFGRSIGDSILEVEVFDLRTKTVKKFLKKDCRFDYRDSIFKRKKSLVILQAVLQLKKGSKKEIEAETRANLNYRIITQPLGFPSAGSIFKNPGHLFAGELIERCGLKGKTIGNVKVSEKHSNFIINLGNGKTKDIKKLINLVKKEVKNKFKVKLQEEIQYLNFKIF